MKLVLLIMLVLLAFCLITSAAEPVAIGGDFGRAWITNYLAKNPSPFPEDNNSSSGNWGNAPKVEGTVGSNIGSKQNATNPITPSSNWLGDPASFGNQLSPQNFTRAPLFISRVSEPVHAIDASWNHTAQIPQPDPMVSYMGGMPKRMTQSGPALDYF